MSQAPDPEEAKRIRKMRWRVIFFAFAPAFPILLMLYVTHAMFGTRFIDLHLDTVEGKPVESPDYFLLKIELRNGQNRLDEARGAVENRTKAGKEGAGSISFDRPTQHLTDAAVWTYRRAVPILDSGRPPAFARRDAAARLSEALADVVAANARLDAAIAACEECAYELRELVAAQARLNATLTRLDGTYKVWADVKAHQPAAWMAAVNATIILMVVAGGTMLWSFYYLLPSEWGGPHYGYLEGVRIAVILFSVALFLSALFFAYDDLRAEPLLIQGIPVIPYRTVTFEFFQRTLVHAYGKGSDLFIWCSYASIGLVAAALLGSFTVMAVASRTYIDEPIANSEGDGSALRRMSVIRNMLYLAAALCVAVLLTTETDFTAAARMFAEATDETVSPARTTIEEIGKVVVQANGIALGLALAAAYLPAAAVLHRPYQKEKAELAGGDEGFLSISGPFGTALRFVAIIAPAVVGGIINAFGG